MSFSFRIIAQKDEIAADAANNLGLTVFDATAIEESKAVFISSQEAVAVFANRYDGIDFPGDECGLLFLDGLPKTTNAQERFFVSRMGAGVLLQGRIQTRVVQAVGRCTRSLQDYSAVVVTGAELTDYLNNPARLGFFHPELQAELDFGARQSSNTTLADMIKILRYFSKTTLLGKRSIRRYWLNAMPRHSKYTQASRNCMLLSALKSIISRIWQGHYEGAVDSAGQVLAELTEPSLKGYRALWQYLAGAAAWYGERGGVAAMGARARSHFANARDAAGGIRWLSNLARFQPGTTPPTAGKQALIHKLRGWKRCYSKLGTGHHARYAKHEKAILDGLASANLTQFEMAQRDLGEMLGFRAGKHESHASPDPWWIAGTFCIVFEDHSNANAN